MEVAGTIVVRTTRVDAPQATAHLPVTRAAGTRLWDMGFSYWDTEVSFNHYDHRFVFRLFFG